jgi:hypothetical protein
MAEVRYYNLEPLIIPLPNCPVCNAAITTAEIAAIARPCSDGRHFCKHVLFHSEIMRDEGDEDLEATEGVLDGVRSPRGKQVFSRRHVSPRQQAYPQRQDIL